MKAAVVHGSRARRPSTAEFSEPAPSAGECRIAVTAAAISHVVKSRASGRHYSSSGRFPFVVGIDGVGRLDDGSRVYFVLPRAPFGGMAERTVAPSAQCLPLPDELDDVTAAAIANPGMSSWAAYAERAKLTAGRNRAGERRDRHGGPPRRPDRQASRAPRRSSRPPATPRRCKSVAALGADVTIPLVDDETALEDRFKEQFAQGVDVVIDYLWGKSAERLLIAGRQGGKGGRADPVRPDRRGERRRTSPCRAPCCAPRRSC